MIRIKSIFELPVLLVQFISSIFQTLFFWTDTSS